MHRMCIARTPCRAPGGATPLTLSARLQLSLDGKIGSDELGKILEGQASFTAERRILSDGAEGKGLTLTPTLTLTLTPTLTLTLSLTLTHRRGSQGACADVAIALRRGGPRHGGACLLRAWLGPGVGRAGHGYPH